jgi:curved DNA-binding protein CbpA
MKDPYLILQVKNTASQKEITKAFRKLVMTFHPDRNPGENTEAEYKEVVAAWELLETPAKRKCYDKSQQGKAEKQQEEDQKQAKEAQRNAEKQREEEQKRAEEARRNAEKQREEDQKRAEEVREKTEKQRRKEEQKRATGTARHNPKKEQGRIELSGQLGCMAFGAILVVIIITISVGTGYFQPGTNPSKGSVPPTSTSTLLASTSVSNSDTSAIHTPTSDSGTGSIHPRKKDSATEVDRAREAEEKQWKLFVEEARRSADEANAAFERKAAEKKLLAEKQKQLAEMEVAIARKQAEQKQLEEKKNR